MAKNVISVVFFLLAIGSFIVSFLQFKEKGPLFNNAYLWASAEERKRMNKKPHYRQSGVVFAFIGVLLLLLALEVLFDAVWLNYVLAIVALITVIYAIVSSIKIK